ncbi:MAG: hypothetical protein WC438_02780 [Candidatus Pacearchaeota archaeon]
MKTNKKPNAREFGSERRFRNALIGLIGKGVSDIHQVNEIVEHERAHKDVYEIQGRRVVYGIGFDDKGEMEYCYVKPYGFLGHENLNQIINKIEVCLAPTKPSSGDISNLSNMINTVANCWAYSNMGATIEKKTKLISERAKKLPKLKYLFKKIGKEGVKLSSLLQNLANPSLFNTEAPISENYNSYDNYDIAYNVYDYNCTANRIPFDQRALKSNFEQWENAVRKSKNKLEGAVA